MFDWDFLADDASFWAFVNVLRLSDWVAAVAATVLLVQLIKCRMMPSLPFMTALAGVMVIGGLNKVSLLNLSARQAVVLVVAGWLFTVLALSDLGSAIERSRRRLLFHGAVGVSAVFILNCSWPMFFPSEQGDSFAVARSVFFGAWVVLFAILQAEARSPRAGSVALACLFVAQALPGVAGSLGLLLSYLDVVMMAAALLGVAAAAAMLPMRDLVPTSV